MFAPLNAGADLKLKHQGYYNKLTRSSAMASIKFPQIYSSKDATFRASSRKVVKKSVHVPISPFPTQDSEPEIESCLEPITPLHCSSRPNSKLT